MRSLVIAVFSFCIMAVGLLLTRLAVDWSSWQPATCLSVEGCFCEAQRAGSVVQPVNAWSSLSFTLAGFLVAARTWQRKAALRTGNPGKGLLYAVAMVVIGLGSAFYHASLTFIGQFFDVLGMYLLVSFLVLVDVQRLGWSRPRWFGWLYIGFNLTLAASLVWLPEARRLLFLGLILLVLVLELLLRLQKRLQREAKYLLLALGAFGLAFVVWNLDNARLWCEPTSILQGHALWHLLGALAGWWMWQYVENE